MRKAHDFKMLYSESVKFIFYKDSSSRLWIFLLIKAAFASIAKTHNMNPTIHMAILSLKSLNISSLKIVPFKTKICRKWEVFPTKIKIFLWKTSHKSTIASHVIVLMMDSSHVGILRREVHKILKKLKITTPKFMSVRTIIVKKNSIFNQVLYAIKSFIQEKSLTHATTKIVPKVSTRNLIWTGTRKFIKMRSHSFAISVVNHSQQQLTWNSIHRPTFPKKNKESITPVRWKDAIRNIFTVAILKNIRWNMMTQLEISWWKIKIRKM